MNFKELAEQAGITSQWISGTETKQNGLLAIFAELVAAHEREECAMLCDRFQERGMQPAECAGAIRQRSKA